MNLYVVNLLVQQVLDECMDRETGEITEEGVKRLDSLGIKKEEVIDQLILAYKNQQMLIDGITAEIVNLEDRVKRLKKTQDSIMKQLRPVLTEGQKIETPQYLLKWTTSTKVDGLDMYDPELEFNNKESLLHTFVIKKIPDPEYSFDKKAIQAELKNARPNLPVDIYINQTKNPKII